MTNDISKGKWKQRRGQAKVWWGKLTDDDREKLSGKVDQFIGRLQEKYGAARQQANDENRKGQNDKL